MSRKLLAIVPLALVVAVLVGSAAPDTQDTRVFEMRVYTTTEGNLDLLHKRFRDHTNRIFVKHGMELVGYWTPTDERADNTLIYVLGYPSQEARDEAWAAFIADPEWQEVFQASREEAGGPIVANIENTFMHATDYSPIK